MSAVADLKLIHGHLDLNPDDWDTRLILADLHEELGDLPRATVQRWLVKHLRHPTRYRSNAPAYWHDTRWDWWFEFTFEDSWRSPGRLPLRIFDVIKMPGSCIYKTRQQAEDDLLRVLELLEVE